MKKGFTIFELLVVIAIIAILASILFPVFASAKDAAKKTTCLSNQRQLALASQQYLSDNGGALFQHHDDWVLDDGSLTVNLPNSVDGCEGGGFGNSQAEKPWAIFFQPYLKNRAMLFCPNDSAQKSRTLSTDIFGYSGGAELVGDECAANPGSEACLMLNENTSGWSYLLNSIWTHKSCRYALEGVLSGFATESALAGLDDPNIIMFSERNSAGFSDPQSDFYYPLQDDYDTWGGEGALIQWGSGSRPNEGWIAHDRHQKGANYVYADGHVRFMKWSQARKDQFPDHVVRNPLP